MLYFICGIVYFFISSELYQTGFIVKVSFHTADSRSVPKADLNDRLSLYMSHSHVMCSTSQTLFNHQIIPSEPTCAGSRSIQKTLLSVLCIPYPRRWALGCYTVDSSTSFFHCRLTKHPNSSSCHQWLLLSEETMISIIISVPRRADERTSGGDFAHLVPSE